MPYEVFARKWRPQLFQDVIGQDHITQTLINAIKTDRLAHAYLFSGARGVGKTSVARILAKAINCEKGKPGTPCNQCQSCAEVTDGSSVDVQEIDGASNRGIDEIRDLRENTKYMPSSSRYRIYIIDEVHMLTLPAFNALLKTLEEPPAHVKFIFATTECHKVPVTILSRCQRFDFKRIRLAEIVSQLEKIAKEENIEISKSGLALISREAEGSMRDAESLLDQVVSFAGPKVDDKHVTEILGIIDRDVMLGASRAIIDGSPKECLEIVDQIYNYGYDIKEFYRALMGQFRNLLISLVVPQNRMLDMSESEEEEVRRQAERAGSEKLQILLNILINREEALRFASYPRLVLETTMIKLCHLGDFLSFGDLLGKIESLEKRLVGSLVNDGFTDTTRVSDPRGQWVSRDQEKDQAHSKGVNESGQTWDDFLTYLSSKSNVMFEILKDWHFQKLTETTLEIAKGNQSFSSTYFEDPEKLKQLSNYCRDFFKRDIKVRIVGNSQPFSQKEPLNGAEKSRSKAKVQSDLPAPVQDILHMFQGEIIGIENKNRSKKNQEVT
jgi:DNA polymerase-3 subunit gamma/tau